MSTVSGRVLLKGTDTGISNLLVRVLDVVGATSSPTVHHAPPTSMVSLGAVLTDVRGNFSLTYKSLDPSGAIRRPGNLSPRRKRRGFIGTDSLSLGGRKTVRGRIRTLHRGR